MIGLLITAQVVKLVGKIINDLINIVITTHNYSLILTLLIRVSRVRVPNGVPAQSP